MTSIRKMRGETVEIPEHPSNKWAKKMRRAFYDKNPETGYSYDFTWPERYHQLGQGRSLAYTSNKWKDNPRDWEDFKHVAESANQVYATDLYLRISGLDATLSGDPWPLYRPTVEMPQTIAELAPCLFSEARLIEEVHPRLRLESKAARLPTKDTILYGGYARTATGSWDRRGDLICFLSVIHPKKGVLLLVTGKELDVEADGIVGLGALEPNDAFGVRVPLPAGRDGAGGVDGFGEVGAVHIASDCGVADVLSTEVGVSKHSEIQVSAVYNCAAEPGVGQLGAAKDGFGEVGAAEVGESEVGAFQEGVAEVSPGPDDDQIISM